MTTITLILVGFCLAFVAFGILDIVFHTMAVAIVIKQDRYDEYFNRFTRFERMMLGSGFKLYKYFSKPKTVINN